MPAPAREADDVPDGEEVARVAERLDEVELARKLPHDVLRRIAAESPARAIADELPEELHSGQARLRRRRDRGALRAVSSRRHQRRERVLAADLVHPEGAAVGDPGSRLQPLGEVAPEPRHLLRSLERPLGVGEEAAPRLLDRDAVPDAGEDVLQHLPPPRVGMDVVGDRDGDAEPPTYGAGRSDPQLLPGDAVARDGQGHSEAEELAEPRHRPLVSAGVEREEAARTIPQRLERDPHLLARPPRRRGELLSQLLAAVGEREDSLSVSLRGGR